MEQCQPDGDNDLEDCCWICLKLTTDGSGYPYSTTGFQMLMRYLGVDLTRLKLTDGEASVCEGCSARVTRFLQFYQDFEALRLHLNHLVQDLSEVIQGSEHDVSVFKTRSVNKLRKETMKKCALKITTYPRLELTKFIIKLENLQEYDNFEDFERCNIVDDDDMMQAEFGTLSPPKKMKQSDSIKPNFVNICRDEDTDEKKRETNRDDKSSSTLEMPPSSFIPLMDLGEYLVNIEESSLNQTLTLNRGTHPCEYCQHYIGKSSVELLIHTVQAHTMEFYSDKIPPGTTGLEVHDATSKTIEMHLDHLQNRGNIKVIKCSSCWKTFKKRNIFKIHILKDHFDEVVNTLKKLTRESVKKSPGTVTNNAKRKLQSWSLKDKYSCDYCPFSGAGESMVRTHAVQAHPMEFYSGIIPPGTTGLQIHGATSITIQKHLAHPDNQNNSKETKCASCPSRIKQRNIFKVHILKHHFDEIITSLKELDSNYQDNTVPQLVWNSKQEPFKLEEPFVKMEPYLVISDEPEVDGVDCPLQDPLSDI